MAEDEHPLDEPLGRIHEIAIKLAMIGQHDLAIPLAEAHEKISKWVIQLPDGTEG